MTKALNHLYSHILISTFEQQPLMTKALRSRLFTHLTNVLSELGCKDNTVGGHSDHIHIASMIQPYHNQEHIIELLKIESAKWISTTFPDLSYFQWQNGYDHFPVSASHIKFLKHYINNQECHHQVECFQTERQRLIKKYTKINMTKRFTA